MWPLSFYKITGDEFHKPIKLIKIPYSVNHFRENPPPVGMKNSVVLSKNCQNSVFRNKFFPYPAVPQNLMTPMSLKDIILEIREECWQKLKIFVQKANSTLEKWGYQSTQPSWFSFTNKNGVLSFSHRHKGVVSKEFSGTLSQTQPFPQIGPHSDSHGTVIDSNSPCTLHKQQFLTQLKSSCNTANFPQV